MAAGANGANNSCLTSVGNWLLDRPRNGRYTTHLGRVVKDPKFAETAVKGLATVIFPTAKEIAEAVGDHKAAEGFDKAKGIASDARIITALATCYVDGTLTRIYHDADEVVQLGRQVAQQQAPSSLLLKLASKVMEAIGTLTYIIGFLVCRPFIFLKRCFGELGAVADGIGQQFSLIMMINHAAGVLGGVFKTIFLANEQPNGNRNQAIIFRELRVTLANWFQNIADFMLDLLPRVGVSLPPAAKIPVSAFIVACGFYKIWEATV